MKESMIFPREEKAEMLFDKILENPEKYRDAISDESKYL